MAKNKQVPCVFLVDIYTDGIGDLYHFIDFVAALEPSELNNSYFVMLTNRAGKAHRIIIDIINSLSINHPLKQYADSAICVSKDHEQITADKLLKEINGPIFIYEVSTASKYYGGFPSLLKINNNFKLFLGEHGRRVDSYDSSQFLGLYNHMGVGPGTVGIFVPNSNASAQTNQAILDRLGIPHNTELSICYSFVHTETNIQLLCQLQIAKNRGSKSKKQLILFFPKGIPSALSEHTKQLLKKSNCRLLDNKGKWLSEAEFAELKIIQSKTATFSVASGDKTTENCFAEGLLPVIEFKSILKLGFWGGVLKTLEVASEQDGLNDAQKEAYVKIKEYIEESISFNNFANRVEQTLKAGETIEESLERVSGRLLKKIEQLDPSCFDFWRNVVCPYIRKNHNVAEKLSRNVKIFRMISELHYNPSSGYANQAKDFFVNLDAEIYNSLIYALLINYVRNGNKFAIIGNVPVAICLVQLLRIRDSDMVSENVKKEINHLVEISYMSKEAIDTIDDCFDNPEPLKFLRFTYDDTEDLKAFFAIRCNESFKNSLATEEKYNVFLRNLSQFPNDFGKEFVAALFVDVFPETIMSSIKEKARNIYIKEHSHNNTMFFSKNKPAKPKVVFDESTQIITIDKYIGGKRKVIMLIPKGFDKYGKSRKVLTDNVFEVLQTLNAKAECSDGNDFTALSFNRPGGQTLVEFSKNLLDYGVKLKIIDAAVMALKKLQDSGVYHNNIKPENILILLNDNGSYEVNFIGFESSCIRLNISQKDKAELYESLALCIGLNDEARSKIFKKSNDWGCRIS